MYNIEKTNELIHLGINVEHLRAQHLTADDPFKCWKGTRTRAMKKKERGFLGGTVGNLTFVWVLGSEFESRRTSRWANVNKVDLHWPQLAEIRVIQSEKRPAEIEQKIGMEMKSLIAAIRGCSFRSFLTTFFIPSLSKSR